MKDIFLCLLMNLKNHGKITSAMLSNEDYISIHFKDNENEYSLTVTQKNLKAENTEDKDNAD